MKRSNLNFYDECMNSPDELFATSEPFCTQNSKFAMGKGYTAEDMLMKPEPFANQLLYASSAGRTDQYFFKKYRECSLHMDAGDKRYFCADVSCDVVLTATKRGVGLPVALLTQDKIDSAMRKDKEAAMREYKNIFTSEGSDKQIISRASIIKNSFSYLPVLKNEDGSYFGIAYDPARRHDNSAIVIAKYWEDPIVGWKMRIVNCITLMDILKKKKMPINTPSQIKELKRLIVDYNGEKCADYENILHIGVDSGSGGAGVPITDFLCEDFELDGITHRGLIDPEFNEGDDRKYPNAVKDKLELISPTKHKTEMFEATIKMMDCNLIEFPEEYLNKGYITLLYKVDKNGNKTQVLHYPSEKEYEKLEKEGYTIEQEIVHLDQQQELALNQIDAMKTEIVNMYRFKQSNGNDRFDLAPDKANKLNDDRCYCFMILGWKLSQLRRESIVNKKKPKPKNVQSMLPIKKPTRNTLL